jgi:Fur family transcriptional regulator, peroxide stress response regulator
MSPRARQTRQREATLRAARSAGDHPTADVVFEAVRREMPRISLGTVYRNLQRLVEEGELGLAPVRDRVSRFDPNTDPHDHFVCVECGRIIDVARERGAEIDLGALESVGYRVEDHELAIYGRCPACAAR